mgnify:CR=1 FL=1
MLILLFLMLVLLVFADSVYLTRINEAITRAENTVVIDSNTMYIAEARSTGQHKHQVQPRDINSQSPEEKVADGTAKPKLYK